MFFGVAPLVKMLAPTVLGAAGSYLGGRIDRHFDQKARSDEYEYLASKGLTPQEIVGGSIGGGRSSAAGVVLGNQANAMESQRRQQAHEQRQRDLDRAVAIRAQDTGLAQTQISASASLGSAALSAGAARYGADLRRATDLARLEIDTMRLPFELRNLANQNETSSPQFQRFLKMLSMSPTNVAAANAAMALPFDPLDPDAVAAATPQERADVMKILLAMSSTSYREAVGAGAAFEDAIGVGIGADRPVLGEPQIPSGPFGPDQFIR
jgi:hypothetical protein